MHSIPRCFATAAAVNGCLSWRAPPQGSPCAAWQLTHKRFRHWNPISLKQLPTVTPGYLLDRLVSAADLRAVINVMAARDKWTPATATTTLVRLAELVGTERDRLWRARCATMARQAARAAHIHLHNFSHAQLCDAVWAQQELQAQLWATISHPDFLPRAMRILQDPSVSAPSLLQDTSPLSAARLASALAKASHPVDYAPLWKQLATTVAPGLTVGDAVGLATARLAVEGLGYACSSWSEALGDAGNVRAVREQAVQAVEGWEHKFKHSATASQH